VDSTTLRVVPVDERVGKRLTECGLGVGGYRHAKHPELQLFLPVPGLEPGEHLLGEPQQGVREKVVDFNLKAPENLERRLVSRQVAPQRLGSPLLGRPQWLGEEPSARPGDPGNR
jgi:hypothetical protein